jgi:quercetin dioxygenase-like cupin family protein
MAFVRAPFPEQAWVPGGHPLERKKTLPSRGLTLLEFEPGFVDPNVCEAGHFMFVLEGDFGLELDSGLERLAPGEGCFLDPGTPHRARVLGSTPVRLLVLALQK